MTTLPRPLPRALLPRAIRRVSATATRTLMATLALGLISPGLAGDDSDVSYEDISHSFVDDYDGGDS